MKKLILFTIVMAIGASRARAAVVYLKGGGSLTGEVVSSSDKQVVIQTSQGRVSVDASRVESIDYKSSPPPAAPAARPAPAAPPAAAGPYVRPHDLFEPRLNTVSFDFGLSVPASSLDFSGTDFGGGVRGGRANNGDLGARIGLQYLRAVTPRSALGVEFAYVDRSSTDSPDLLPNAFSHVSGDSVILLANWKYMLTKDGEVRPYVLFGAGGHYTSTTVDAHPNPGFVWSDTLTSEGRRIVDGSEWGPAMSVRLGLDFLFAQPTIFGLEVGWTGLANSKYRPTSQGQDLGLPGGTNMLNLITFSGRWGWSF